MTVAQQELRKTMKALGFSSKSIVEKIQNENPNSTIKKHDVDNIICGYSRSVEKIKMIARVLGRPANELVPGVEDDSTMPNTNQEAIPYIGHIYISCVEIVEKLFIKYDIPISSKLIHEYALEAHDYAQMNKLDTPELWEIFADGSIRSARRAGIFSSTNLN